MNRLYFVFKTAVTPEINLKMGMDAYLAATKITCFAYAINDDKPRVCVGDIYSELNGTDFDFVALAHNLDFHAKVWRAIGLPEPKGWLCTMQNWKKQYEKAKFGMDAICTQLALPPRIKVDEFALAGAYTDELGYAAMRDVEICRSIMKHLETKPAAAEGANG